MNAVSETSVSSNAWSKAEKVVHILEYLSVWFIYLSIYQWVLVRVSGMWVRMREVSEREGGCNQSYYVIFFFFHFSIYFFCLFVCFFFSAGVYMHISTCLLIINMACRTISPSDKIPSAHFCVGGQNPLHVFYKVDIIPFETFYRMDIIPLVIFTMWKKSPP